MTKREFTRIYHLSKIEVCRELFIKTLGISSKRVNTALAKVRNLAIPDKRGCAGGHNKLATDVKDLVINHINKIPRYKSHYCRESANKQEFLPIGMTVDKMFRLYKEDNPNSKLVSFSTYRKIFLTEFNLRTKQPKKDTCNKCDTFSAKIVNATAEETETLKLNHDKHLEDAKLARDKMTEDMKKAKQFENIETLSFDLEKTLPLPRISTNIIYYKRQLMLYNAGVHSGKNDKGYFNIWLEGQAGRGAQEVGSTLRKHILNYVDDDVTDLHLWSDSCGGQNRNIKIVLMLKGVLHEHKGLQTIHLCFLEPGHTFLPNDSDFGDVECYLKKQQYMFSPEDYKNLMKTCRKKNPFVVNDMLAEELFSTLEIEQKITNRKVNTNKEKVNWLKIRTIKICKAEPFTIFYKTNFRDDEYTEINIKKRIKSRSSSTSDNFWAMPLLWPDGKPILQKKLDDIKSYLHLIPSHLQNFYINLTGDENIEEDIEGYNGNLDFEIEVDE